jgi:flagellar biosynthesis protein FlhG
MNFDLSSSFIVSTASGKGGIGKTMATVNMAESLVAEGHKVALIDADLGLSNCAALMNEQVPATALDVLREQSYVDDLFQTTGSGITLVTGADEPDPHIRDWSMLYPVMDEVIRKLRSNHDFILIDTPAGTSDLSLWALDRSDLCTLILADEPTVISDVYRFCKFVMDIDPAYPFATIVNFADDASGARSTASRFNSILNHFMDRDLSYLGYISASDEIRDSIRQQVPVTKLHPDSLVTQEFRYIAQTLIGISKTGSDSLETKNLSMKMTN